MDNNTERKPQVCVCGHSIQTHMHNMTGEMFGSEVAHCAWCECREFREE